MATSAAVAALLSPRALPVLGAGGATRGLGQRSLLSQRADAWFFWRQEVVGLGVQAATAGLPHPVSQSLELGDIPARIWHLGTGAGRHSRSHAGSTSPHGDTRHRASTGLCSRNWGTAQHGLGRIRPSLQAWCGVAAVPLLGDTAMGTRARGAVEPLGWLPAPSPWLFATQCRLHSW